MVVWTENKVLLITQMITRLNEENHAEPLEKGVGETSEQLFKLLSNSAAN